MLFIGLNLCSPAYHYFTFSISLRILFVIIKFIYSIIFKVDILKFLIIKIISLIFFVFLLNALCYNNLIIESWILMFFLILSWILFYTIPNLLP